MSSIKTCSIVRIPSTSKIIEEDELISCEHGPAKDQLFVGRRRVDYTNYSTQQYRTQYLYLYEDVTIKNKGKCNAICLGELETPEEALIFDVGNCEACREIVASNDPAVNVPRLSSAFLEYYTANSSMTAVNLKMTTNFCPPEQSCDYCNGSCFKLPKVLELTRDNEVKVEIITVL